MLRGDILIADQQGYALPQYVPEVLIFPNLDGVDEYTANSVIEQISRKPSSVLTLPTGNTPRGMYERLVTANQEGRLDLSQTTVFNLDEYYPIASMHPNSYTEYMRKYFINKVNIRAWHIPNGEALDPSEEAERYAQLLDRHQSIDLAVIGIGPGTTCHIGFNERGSLVSSRVRYVALDPETRIANARLFDNPHEIPNGTLTQGVSDILQAKRILLIAKGQSKAWGINRTLTGPISSEAPASYLRYHPNVAFVLDTEAAYYIK